MTQALRALLALLALALSLAAMAEVPVPALTARVTDQTATLSPAQRAALEDKLSAFETLKGSQLAVLIVPTTAEETIEQYSLRVVEQWRLGRKKIDDGALLIVAKDDRTLRIEVGYGLEGALNDATSKRIISETIVPHFRQGDFYGGIDTGIEQMMRVVAGEPLPAPPARSAHDERPGLSQIGPLAFLFVIVGGAMLRALFGRLAGATLAGAGAALLAWFVAGALSIAAIAGLIAFFFTLLGGGMGSRGGWHSGGSGGISGGFGGGGFGGGGGGFGGGGASGRW